VPITEYYTGYAKLPSRFPLATWGSGAPKQRPRAPNERHRGLSYLGASAGGDFRGASVPTVDGAD